MASAHPSGTGGADASTAGSVHSTATSLAASVTSTRPSTLTAGVICTSTAAAVPTTCWFVAIRPRPSMTNPEARAVGVQSATTLACHVVSTSDGSAALVAGAALAGRSPTSALAAVNSSVTSRPAGTSSVCVHW